MCIALVIYPQTTTRGYEGQKGQNKGPKKVGFHDSKTTWKPFKHRCFTPGSRKRMRKGPHPFPDKSQGTKNFFRVYLTNYGTSFHDSRHTLKSVRHISALAWLFYPGSAFIKPDQRNPWIKDQIKITLLPIISHLLLPNFVSCGRACPSHMTQNLVTVGAKLWTADRFIVDPWSMDYADPVW